MSDKEYQTKYQKAIADAKFLNKQREMFLKQIGDLEEGNKVLQETIETWEQLFDEIKKIFKVRTIKELRIKLKKKGV